MKRNTVILVVVVAFASALTTLLLTATVALFVFFGYLQVRAQLGS